MDAPQRSDLATLLAEVRRIEVQAARFARDALSGGKHALFRGAGVEFADVREYAAGDDRRSVDWNVTARMGRPFVRRFVDERELRILFLVDVSATMDGGFGALGLRGAAARVVASLALSAIESGDRVGLLAFDEGVRRYVRPEKGRRHALGVVREALALPTGQGAADIGGAMEVALRLLRRRSIVVLVSDFANFAPSGALSALARRHDLVAVRLLPPELFALPPMALLLRDPVSGNLRTVDGASARVQAQYQTDVADWRERVDGALAHARVDCVDVTLPLDPLDGEDADVRAMLAPLARYFRGGAARRPGA
ncbi:MAG: DUF58 domain-containing protein [Planctomycetaceae bacterium]|nr:DUF58 domain-containing protein [Planctomycetaceae bacterium]